MPIAQQPKNPLHGITLQVIVEALVEKYGWEKLGQLITLKCFAINPSVKSSLNFLRKTPWARKKVENLYLRTFRLRKQKQYKTDSSHEINQAQKSRSTKAAAKTIQSKGKGQI